jgi:hypothetical protein
VLNPMTGASRLVRVVALGGGALAVTVAGHVAAAGGISPLGALIVGIVMVLIAVFVTSTELTLGPLFAFVGGAQLGSHFLLSHFSHAGHAAHTATSSVPMSAPSHAHGAGSVPISPVGADGAGFVSDAFIAGFVAAAPMLFMHAIAALAMALLLRMGEKTFFNLSRLLPGSLQVLLGLLIKPLPIAALPQSRPNPVAHRTTVFGLTEPYLSHEIARRGPPAALAYAATV